MAFIWIQIVSSTMIRKVCHTIHMFEGAYKALLQFWFLIGYLRFPWSSDELAMVDKLSVKHVTVTPSWHTHTGGQSFTVDIFLTPQKAPRYSQSLLCRGCCYLIWFLDLSWLIDMHTHSKAEVYGLAKSWDKSWIGLPGLHTRMIRRIAQNGTWWLGVD